MWLRSGHIQVNGAIVPPNSNVWGGESIEVRAPEDVRDSPAAAEAIDLNIIFEDESILVIDKPAGMVVHPAAGNPTGTLVNALIAHCGASLSGIGGVRRPGIVHRLDKDTTWMATDRPPFAFTASTTDDAEAASLL